MRFVIILNKVLCVYVRFGLQVRMLKLTDYETYGFHRDPYTVQ